jgi:hypothetical protein
MYRLRVLNLKIETPTRGRSFFKKGCESLELLLKYNNDLICLILQTDSEYFELTEEIAARFVGMLPKLQSFSFQCTDPCVLANKSFINQLHSNSELKNLTLSEMLLGLPWTYTFSQISSFAMLESAKITFPIIKEIALHFTRLESLDLNIRPLKAEDKKKFIEEVQSLFPYLKHL